MWLAVPFILEHILKLFRRWSLLQQADTWILPRLGL